MNRPAGELLTALRGFLVQGDLLTGVTPLSTGHSHETYLLEGLDLVLRMPPPQTPLVESGHGVRTQFELYAALSGMDGGPPVPGVRYLHPTPEVLGEPFFLMQHIRGQDAIGDYGPAQWFAAATPKTRESVISQWVNAISNINQIGPLDVLGPPRTNAEELQRWHTLARRSKTDGIVEIFDQLAMAIPPTATPTLVHGDPKPANTLWRDAELVTLLDWEMSFNGDPAWDLGYMLIFLASDQHPAYPGCDLPGIWSREQLLSMWVERTGRSIADHLWFEAASTAKVCSLLAYGHHLARTGQSSDERMHVWGPFAAQLADQTRAVLEAASRLTSSQITTETSSSA